MVLAEDGTIVDDEDYFLCLPSNTKFVALAKGERWSGKSAGSGGAGRLFPAGRNGGGERSCRVRAGLCGAESEKGPQKGGKLPQILRPRPSERGSRAREPRFSKELLCERCHRPVLTLRKKKQR